MSGRIHANPGLYREMSEPFASSAEADDAISAFYDELGELRKKHRIANIYCIVSGSSLDEQGEEGEFIATSHYGDAMRAESLTAYAYGKEQIAHQELISRMVGQGKRK